MAYVRPNFKSKAALKRALTAGEMITVYQPGLGSVPIDGIIDLEGPHFPEPHKWYATGTMKEGRLVSVK
ncbi:MAG: hypothetical protein ACXADW_13575 [Candidatus Hodarchaeales archaeon]|jgi:hypothetical protein